jgi:hypothetical protein
VVQAYIPEVVTGLIGVAFIVWAVISSISYSKKQSLETTTDKETKNGY